LFCFSLKHLTKQKQKKFFQTALKRRFSLIKQNQKFRVIKMDRETYEFHQTPSECARDLLQNMNFDPTDILYEPFKGEGAFYNNFPVENPKLWTELEEGRDYKDMTEEYDWVLTNPPFRLETGGQRVNAFWFLVDYFSQRARKGIAFLGNDACFGTLTPKRLNILKERGWSITTLTVCSIKKWRGRYFWIVFEKKESTFYKHLLPNY
jgi:hypothetical protein